MATILRKEIVALVVLLAFAPTGLGVGHHESPSTELAYFRGLCAAALDVIGGNYKEFGAGPSDALPEYTRLLRSRYGIEHHQVGCVFSDSTYAYMSGYNTISTAAAEHKFGPDVFKECYRDAVRLHQTR